jgi:dTDP-glucose 4,6-dehydratase
VTNCSNNYGPYQFPEKLIPLTLINILRGRRLPVYGDGLQVRDWLHVADHCEAITLALTRGRAGEVYNIGGNAETANIHVVRTLCALADEIVGARADLKATFASSPVAAGRPAVQLIEHVRDRPGHDRRYAIDYRKAARELGYAPQRDLARGLRDTVDWYLSHQAWWEALLGRDYSAWVENNYGRR